MHERATRVGKIIGLCIDCLAITCMRIEYMTLCVMIVVRTNFQKPGRLNLYTFITLTLTLMIIDDNDDCQLRKENAFDKGAMI